MADDYTPTTEEVRGFYIQAGEDWGDGITKSAAEFDRWLAAHDAEKRAEWEAAVFECPNCLMDVAPPTPDPKETP